MERDMNAAQLFHSEPLPADDPRFIAALDLQIAQMRRVLDLMGPSSSAEALRSLREAFPEASLEERVRAMAG